MTALPEHFMISETDGGLYDTRRERWYERPVRTDYKKHFQSIKNTDQLKASIRAEAYAWPGGYNLVFVTYDGGTLCFDCVKQNFRYVLFSIRHNQRDDWRAVGITNTNDTDGQISCDNCYVSLTET